MASVTLTTDTNAAATGYGNQRKLDYFQKGTKLAGFIDASNNAQFYWSSDGGATWTSMSSPIANVLDFSMFVDLDDNVHVAWTANPNSNGHYYVFGTPNAGRTSISWGTPNHYLSGSDTNYTAPDLIALRDPAGGGGWRAVTVHGYSGGSGSRFYVYQFTITSGGAVTYNGTFSPGGGATTNTSTASIDFQHNGDGKTAANSSPKLYVVGSEAGNGVGEGIVAAVPTYSAGSWGGGPVIYVDTTHFSNGVFAVLNGFFDGTRFVAGGVFDNATNYDVMLFDAIDTSPVVHTLISSISTGSEGIFYGSCTYDQNRNVYLVGGSATTNTLGYYVWTRIGGSLSARNSIDINFSPSGHAQFSIAKRNTGTNAVEIVYTQGNSSPYNVQYDLVATFNPIMGIV